MEQILSHNHSDSASIHIYRLLWNQTIHYHVHKITSPVPILNGMVQFTPFHRVWNIYFNMSHLGLADDHFPSDSATKILYIHSHPLTNLIH
jgi:hypothetical protein